MKGSKYLLLVEKLPWVSVTPTLHKLLSHCWELKELDRFGLKIWNEEGLEANNKCLRNYQEKLSRKTNQLANLQDCSNRMWVKSNPVVGVEHLILLNQNIFLVKL